MFNIFFKEPSYENIYTKFIESTEDNIIENIGNIKKFILNKEIVNIDELKDQITLKTNTYNHNKLVVSSLKTLSILINKTYYNNTILLKKLHYLIKISNRQTNDYQKKYNYIMNKIISQIRESKQQCSATLETLENLITEDQSNQILKAYPHIFYLINTCKARFPNMFINSSLENILYKCDSQMYKYIYFLKSMPTINSKETAFQLLTNYNFQKIDNKTIDNMELKRGFIQEYSNSQTNKNYLLKYQPNRSIMEIVLNVYIKNISIKSGINSFLFPDYFFINEDMSYCYIIEKYDIDLSKYFNILGEYNSIFTLSDILNILRYMITCIKFLFQNNIIHSDLKLENIVLNYDKPSLNNPLPKINKLKLIDFDVSIFNSIPDILNPIPNEYKKTLNNKKVRGTKIYMLNDRTMSFKNDIYSLGMVLLILLLKNIKLMISIKKRTLNAEKPSNKKIIIKYNILIKQLNALRNEIEIDDNKLKMIDFIKEFIEQNSTTLNFYTTINDNLKFPILLDFIKDCIKTKYNIEELEGKYGSLLESS